MVVVFEFNTRIDNFEINAYTSGDRKHGIIAVKNSLKFAFTFGFLVQT